MAVCVGFFSNDVKAEMRLMTAVNTCDLCGGNQFAPELKVGSWHLMRCSDCGLVFTSPRYTADTINKIYSEEYYQNAADYYRSQLSQPSADDLSLTSAANRALDHKDGRSLDVGCGTGRLVEAFQRAGFQALGIEPNKMAAEAGQQFKRNVMATDLSEMPASSRDCITAMHVLEHTYSPRDFLRHCHRILGDGGLLIVEVPNYASRAARRLKEHWEPLYPDTHLYQFTPDTLTRYLSHNGFKTLTIQKVGGAGCLQHAVRQTVNGHGGLEGPDAGTVAHIDKMRFREWIWESRRLIFRIPFAREVIRYLFWQVLGQGEFVRIFAFKIKK